MIETFAHYSSPAKFGRRGIVFVLHRVYISVVMRNHISYFIKAALILTLVLVMRGFSVYSQQHIIVNKDNTRPETTRQLTLPAKITSLEVARFNGYNEVQWGAVGEQDTRRFVAEFTTNGEDYQTAGELAPHAGLYRLEHYTVETRPMIYRLRIEKKDGSFYYTDATLLDGIAEKFTKIFPTTVRGNVLNVIADFPAERATIVGLEGQNIFSKELGGVTGTFTMAIPSLKKGIYWITFYGRGWNNTIPFLVAG